MCQITRSHNLRPQDGTSARGDAPKCSMARPLFLLPPTTPHKHTSLNMSSLLIVRLGMRSGAQLEFVIIFDSVSISRPDLPSSTDEWLSKYLLIPLQHHHVFFVGLSCHRPYEQGCAEQEVKLIQREVVDRRGKPSIFRGLVTFQSRLFSIRLRFLCQKNKLVGAVGANLERQPVYDGPRLLLLGLVDDRVLLFRSCLWKKEHPRIVVHRLWTQSCTNLDIVQLARSFGRFKSTYLQKNSPHDEPPPLLVMYEGRRNLFPPEAEVHQVVRVIVLPCSGRLPYTHTAFKSAPPPPSSCSFPFKRAFFTSTNISLTPLRRSPQTLPFPRPCGTTSSMPRRCRTSPYRSSS